MGLAVISGCVLRSEAEQGKVHWGRWAQTHGPHAAVSGREGEGAGR
jgi:ribosomal protein L35AE/L33A